MSQLQIAFMPYIPSSKFTFGNLCFWPFDEPETKSQFSPDVLSYLEWYFQKHVNIMLQPLDVTLVAYKQTLLGPWTDDQIKEMYDTVACLSFLSLWNNSCFTPVSSDNFTLFLKSFSPEQRSFLVSRGSYIRTDCIYSGDIAEKVLFVMPETTPSYRLGKQPWLNSMFEPLSKAFTAAYSEEWFNRIIRSIRILNSAYSNVEGIDYFDRVLLLVTALESLISENTQSRVKFGSAILKAIGINNDDSFSKEINSKIRSFSEKLYEVRSRYSHGQILSSRDVVHPEYGELFRSGVYMYGLVIKSLLRQQGYIEFKDEFGRVISEIRYGLFSVMDETCPKNK